MNYLDLTENRSLSYPSISNHDHIVASPSESNYCFHHSLNPLSVRAPSNELNLLRIVVLNSFSSLIFFPIISKKPLNSLKSIV